MKTRPFFLILACAALLIGYLLYRVYLAPGESIESINGSGGVVREQNGQVIEIENPDLRRHVEDYTKDIDLTESEKALRQENVPLWRFTLGKALHRDKEKESNGEVLLYGIVLDENDLPVLDASISAIATQFPLPYEESLKDPNSRKIQINVRSDAGGRFVVTGYRAQSLLFHEIKKAGYVVAAWPSSRVFYFGSRFPERMKASPENPIEFRLKRVD